MEVLNQEIDLWCFFFPVDFYILLWCLRTETSAYQFVSVLENEWKYCWNLLYVKPKLGKFMGHRRVPSWVGIWGWEGKYLCVYLFLRVLVKACWLHWFLTIDELKIHNGWDLEVYFELHRNKQERFRMAWWWRWESTQRRWECMWQREQWDDCHIDLLVSVSPFQRNVKYFIEKKYFWKLGYDLVVKLWNEMNKNTMCR